jgi:hypothetical protein
MDEPYVCPDCGAEHTEPLEAALGHRALCLTCAIIAEGGRPIPVRIETTAVTVIAIDRHKAA